MPLGVIEINLPIDPKAVATTIKKSSQRTRIIYKLTYLNGDIQRAFNYKQDLKFDVLFNRKSLLFDFASSTDKKIYKLMWYLLAFSAMVFIIFNTLSALFKAPILSLFPPFLYVLFFLYEVYANTKGYENKDRNKEDWYKLQIVYYKFAENREWILALVSVLSAFQVLVTSAMIFTSSNFAIIEEISNIAFIISFVIVYLYVIFKIYYFLFDAKIYAEDLLLDIGSKNINLKIITNHNKVIRGKLTSIGKYLRLESKNYKFAVDWSDIIDIAVHK
jgi:hypothetical protein